MLSVLRVWGGQKLQYELQIYVCLRESLEPENLCVGDPEPVHQLQLHRHPVRGVVAQRGEVVVYGLVVHLGPDSGSHNRE